MTILIIGLVTAVGFFIINRRFDKQEQVSRAWELRRQINHRRRMRQIQQRIDACK